MSISIIGGGIGGLILGNVLKQHHIDFKIYDSAPEIKTRRSRSSIRKNQKIKS
ncbi:NAD(P)-binding protein [Epilithonimonas sp. UC225_85]|uniref:NAD(P)-binding protein n=1 Tax=Epilithonimonas sp. UC225_85 TaxID=3350167 RepID=UPI0036D30BE5